ncbi:MAG: hypothetical protein E7381_03070 [Clostridiales bacterium]|nr:hypothetical protein [Clostridiales bacterium]
MAKLGKKIATLWKTTKWFKVASICGAVVIVASAIVLPNVISDAGGISHECDFSMKNIDTAYSYSEATCTEKAKYYYSCACGAKGTEWFEYGNALGHDLIHHENKQATCINIGYEEYDTCIRCEYSTYEEIPATGHIDGEWVIDTNATCTEKGLKYQECSVCYEKINEAEIEQLGHMDSDWVYDNYPTCTESGLRHKLCARCKHTYNSETVKEKGHTPGVAVMENKVDATCEIKGYYDEVVYCTVDSCNAEISRIKKEISQTDHNYVSYVCIHCNAPQSGVKFIYNFEDLQNINNNRSAIYVLMNDIDCKGLAITPIGSNNTAPFSGMFDGCGHTISNYIATNAQYIGIFGYSTGQIRNLNVENFDFDIITNSFDKITVGGIVGYNAGLIEKCAVSNGNIYISSACNRLGALLCGESIGTIKNCFATGSVYVTQPYENAGGSFAAGITTFNYGTIEKCFVDATLYSYGKNGGYSILGGGGSYGEAAFITTVSGANSSISDCFVMGSISTANNRAGDISGYCYNGVQITNCYKDENLVLCSSNNVHINATVMSLSTMSLKLFFSVTLKWDNSVWNYDNVNLSNKVYPKLKQD